MVDLRSDSGIALPAAILAIFALTSLIGIMVVTVVGQERAGGFQTRFEASLHTAEAGAELELVHLNQVPSHVTEDSAGTPHQVPGTVDVDDPVQLEIWARTAAAASDWTQTAVGRAVGLRPLVAGAPADFVLGVGEVGDRERVVKLDIAQSGLPYAVLAGGSLDLSGTTVTVTNDGTETGTPPEDRYATPLPVDVARLGIHANADVRIGAAVRLEVDGGVTASGTYDYPHGFDLPSGPHPARCYGAVNCHPSNPQVNPAGGDIHAGGAQPTVTIPTFSARQLYEQNGSYTPGGYGSWSGSSADPWPISGDWFDLCPDGTVRQPDQTSPFTPCNGTPLIGADLGTTFGVEGWTFSSGSATWTRRPYGTAPFNPFGQPSGPAPRLRHSAVWYAYQSNIVTEDSFGVAQTLIAEAVPGDSGATGNISVQGSGPGYATVMPDVLFMADRDLGVNSTVSGQLQGLLLAGEGVELSGSMDILGGVIVRNDPDTVLSTLRGSTACGASPTGICGQTHLLFRGSETIPGSGPAPPKVVGWSEL